MVTEPDAGIVADAELLNTAPGRYAMAMRQHETEWTVDMLDALPDDGQRYEIIDGVLFVSPAPTWAHQGVTLAIASRLRTYLRPYDIGRGGAAPTDVWRDDRRRNRVQPDAFAVRLIDGRVPSYPFKQSDLLLAVEVESPSTQGYDYETKRREYLSHGVAEYWVVSIEERTFTRWRSLGDIGEILNGRIIWQPEGMPDPLIIDISEFFEDALG